VTTAWGPVRRIPITNGGDENNAEEAADLRPDTVERGSTHLDIKIIPARCRKDASVPSLMKAQDVGRVAPPGFEEEYCNDQY
jgi:hypothetical protein